MNRDYWLNEKEEIEYGNYLAFIYKMNKQIEGEKK